MSMAPSTLFSLVHNKSRICNYLSQYVHPGIKFLVKTVARHNNEIREIASTVTSNMSKVDNFANACIGNFGQIEVAYQSLQANTEQLKTRLASLVSDLNTKFAEHVNLFLAQHGIYHKFSSKLEAFANATNKTLVELTANFITLSIELEKTQKQNDYFL